MGFPRLLSAALVTALFTLGATPASASEFVFRYQTIANGFVTGRLVGDLQADGNTILIQSIADFVKVNGVAGQSLPFVTTGSTIYGTFRAPSATLDGSLLDFFGCIDEFCSEGIGFDPDTVEFRPIISSLGAGFPEFRENTTPGQWQLSAVPEPASWALMITGFGLIGGALRRKHPARVRLAMR
jgi:hypothetical protein